MKWLLLIAVFFAALAGNAPAEELALKRTPALVILEGTVVLSQPSDTAEPAPSNPIYKRAASSATSSASVSSPAQVKLTRGGRVVIVAESKDRRWRRVDLGYTNGWVPYESVATFDKFERVRHWTGPQSIHVEAGDYAATVQFLPNGDYIEDADVPDHTKGRLYSFGDFIWAVSRKSQDFFVRRGARLCWADDLSQCAAP